MNLEFITTPELLTELSKRLNAYLLVFEKDGDVGATTETRVLWTGSFTHAMGLLEYAHTFFEVIKANHFISHE